MRSFYVEDFLERVEPPLDDGGERHRAGRVERWHPEAREGAARGRRIALSDDLAEGGARREIDRLDGLASAPHGREKRDVAPIVQRRGIEVGEGARRDSRRCAPDDSHRPEAPPRGRKDPLHGLPPRHRRLERDVAGLVKRRDRVSAESREGAASRRRVALGRDRVDASTRRAEVALAGAAPKNRREERHVSVGVDRGHDRQDLDAEALEDAAPWRRLADDHDALEDPGLGGHAAGDADRGDKRQQRGESTRMHLVRL